MSKWYYYWKPIKNLTKMQLISIIEVQNNKIQELLNSRYDNILLWSHTTKHAKKTQANESAYSDLTRSGKWAKENSIRVTTIKRR